ncbi:MAG TPA: hypothetical protein VGL93_27785 [Streptosporangiaceae bacterium]|jgi:hypothetical protein
MQDTGVITVRPENIARTGRTSAPALDTAYRAAVALWVGVSAVQLVVYLALAAADGSLDAPWFLWSTGAGALIVGGLRYARTHPVRTWLK